MKRAELAEQPPVGPSRDNPYSPIDGDELQLGRDEPLTDETAKRARTIADGALPIYLSCLLTVCFCLPILPLLLPLHAYRLVSWWQLYTSHSQLREPNSLSPYAETELAFQNAGWRYVVSVSGGVLLLAVMATILIINITR